MAGSMKEIAQTQLGLAIKSGSLRDVQKLIRQGEDPLYKDRKENTYLHFLATMYRPYIFHAFVLAGIDINAQNIHGNTALHVTALCHECCHVPDLMACGIDPGIKSHLGKTASQIAEMENQRKWLDLYRKYEPGLRQAIKNRDLDKIYYLLHAWSACHLAVEGKDMRHLAASLHHYDIVEIVDKYRFSVLAVFAVYQRDKKTLEYAISRGPNQCDVNYLQILTGSHPHHILQHAIRHKSLSMVQMICEAGADLNIYVHVNEYVRGPLYFEALHCIKGQDDRIAHEVLEKNVDLSLKDERGRTALIYVLDPSNGRVSIEIVQKLLKMGASISDRDQNGCTARDMAIFGQRADVIEEIDQHLISFVREPDLDKLREIATEGYDRIMTEYQYRDTWIFACGNPMPEARVFVENLTDFAKASKSLHSAIEENEDLDELEYIYDTFQCDQFNKTMLLRYKDKGGRNTLLKAILYSNIEMVRWLLKQDGKYLVTQNDNMDRCCLHYAWTLEEEGQPIRNLLKSYFNKKCVDCIGQDYKVYEDLGVTFIKDERKKCYGMELQVHCAEKYTKMLKIIRSPHREKRHLEYELKELKVPISQLPLVLHPSGHVLVIGYKDLLLEAIKYNKQEIACKLAFHGVDCSVREKYTDVLWPDCPVYMTAQERAGFLNMDKLVTVIEKHGTDMDYWHLGLKQYLKLYG